MESQANTVSYNNGDLIKNKIKEIISYSARSVAMLFATGTLIQTFLSSLGIDTDKIYLHSTFLQAANVLSILIFSQWAEKGIPIKRTAITALPLGLLFLFYIPLAIANDASLLSYIIIVVIGVAQQVAIGLFTVCQYKLPYYVFKADEYGQVLSICGIVSSLLSLGVSAIISALTATVSFIWVAIGGFCLSALLMLIVCAVTLSEKSLIPITPIEKENKPIVPLGKLIKEPIFIRLVPANFLRGFAMGATTVLATVALDLGYDEKLTTTMVTVYSIASLLTTTGIAFLSKIIKPSVQTFFGSIMTALLPILLIKNSLLFLIVYAIIMIGRTFVDYAVPSMLIKIVPVEIAGPFNAWRMMLTNLGSLLATFIAAYIPTYAFLIVSAIFSIISGTIFYIVNNQFSKRNYTVEKKETEENEQEIPSAN